MEPQVVFSQNLKAWNEVAPRHAELNFAETKLRINGTRCYFLHRVLREQLERINLAEKTVAQFNCNNGRELISALQLGASQGYGFDFSSAFIQQARILASTCELQVEFVETNIYDIPIKYAGIADVLLMTSGALCWMPDLHKYFDMAWSVLKPGGTLLIYETHPFLEMFKLDRERTPDEAFTPHYPYFMKDPVKSTAGLDYYSSQIYGKEVVYWYHHTLSGILQPIIDSGFALRVFSEFEHDSESGYAAVRAFAIRPPMSYLVSATK